MFGERLRKLRSEKKRNQEEMANYLGITRQGYGNYEKENTEPDQKTLNMLADYFDVSTDYLLGRTDNRQPIDEKKEDSEIFVSFIHGKKTIDLEDEEELEMLEQQLQIFREYRDRKRKEREQQDK